MDDIMPPRLIKRQCAGWLALAAKGDPIRIGVTGVTEEVAQQKFYEAMMAWKRIFKNDRAHTARISENASETQSEPDTTAAQESGPDTL